MSAESCELMGLLEFNLTPLQAVHNVEYAVKPPLTKDAILISYKDVFEGLGHIATPHLWQMTK